MNTGGFVANQGTVYLRDVPKALHTHFKAACTRRGRSMKDVIMEFMRQFAKHGHKLNGMKTATKRTKMRVGREQPFPVPIKLSTVRKDKGVKRK